MSTFSGIGTAFSGLAAARAGIEAAGQNIANANTEGYTRQRVETSSVAPANSVGRSSSTAPGVGLGVVVDNVSRLGDEILDTRVRNSLSAAGYTVTRAIGLDRLESTLNEPSKDGLSSQLDSFWASWSDLGNSAGNESTAAAVIAEANVVATRIAAGYKEVTSQWQSTRSEAENFATQLNVSAKEVAALNKQISTMSNVGGNVNELIDKRNLAAESVANLAGGTVNHRPDGSTEILVGGNPIVSGENAYEVRITGPHTMGEGPVRLEWSARPGAQIPLDGGKIAGSLSLLQPANSAGTGGTLAEAGAVYDSIAVALHKQVNELHESGQTFGGETGKSFFGLTAGTNPASGLVVIPTDMSGLATGKLNAGAFDGSMADQISQLGNESGSADNLWSTFVTRIGVGARTESQHATIAELSLTNAKIAQLGNSSVDLDEENVSLLTNQTAYQAASRALTAIDEMLDTLINRTGRVGL